MSIHTECRQGEVVQVRVVVLLTKAEKSHSAAACLNFKKLGARFLGDVLFTGRLRKKNTQGKGISRRAMLQGP